MTLTVALLVMTGILSLSLVCVTLYALNMVQTERRRASREFERMNSVSKEAWTAAQESSRHSREMAQWVIEAIRDTHRSDQQGTAEMMKALSSTVSGIASPPPQPPSPPSPAQLEMERQLAAMWEPQLVPDVRPLHEQNGGAPAGWTMGAVNPFENLPADVPEPLGESAQLPYVDPPG